MVERIEAEIAKMEADMQSQMSETPSAKSRVDELIAQAQIDDEEEKSHQSQQSRAGDLHEADEDEEESGSDDDNTRVFYKASELIVS